MREVLAFQRRYGEALGEIFGINASAEQMTWAVGMFPGLAEAMKRFQEEGIQMAGTAMLTEMTFENVRGQAQMDAPPPQEEPSRGRFGGLGGLGSRIGRAIGGGGGEPGEPRSTIFTTTTELLSIDGSPGSPDTSLVVIPADFTEK